MLKTLGIGAGFVAFVMSVAGEIYRDEGIVGQRAVGWLILIFAVIGVISIIDHTLELRRRLDRCERLLRADRSDANI